MRAFEDPDGLPRLAPAQTARLVAWRRPRELTRAPVIAKAMSPYSVTQELVSDCSFLASLCIAARWEQRTGKRLISAALYPQDRAGNPVVSDSGCARPLPPLCVCARAHTLLITRRKYCVKLYFNGLARKVIIDDRLPVDASNKLLCSYSSDSNEMWVSLIERAYMKLHGGYDFPGSHSGIDVYALTGWLPECVRIPAAGEAAPSASPDGEAFDVS